MKYNKAHWLPVVIAFLLSLAVQARGDTDFSGTYANDKLTLQLHRQGDGYAGQVTMGQQQFPVTASGNDSGLKGSFSNGTDSYDFTATMAGGALNFTTGHSTYTLNRAHNPLDDDNSPAAAPAATPAPVPAPAAAAKSGDLIGKWTSDGNNPGGKFSLTLDKNGSANVEDANGSSSSMDGCTYAANAITFAGSVSMNDLNIGGTWKLTWNSPDNFKATDDNGKTFTMGRQGAAAAPAPQNFTPTRSVSPSAPAEVTNPQPPSAIDQSKLLGTWRLVKGNATMLMTFNADGSCINEHDGQKASGAWKLAGNQLTISHADNQTPPQTTEDKAVIMTLDDQHMVLSPPDTKAMLILDRVQQ